MSVWPSQQEKRNDLGLELTDYRFCDVHEHCAASDKESWLFQRDIIFSLIFPLLEVYRQASLVAAKVAIQTETEDIESVFKGEAQDAFTWLQELVDEDSEWCTGEGCPGNSPPSFPPSSCDID